MKNISLGGWLVLIGLVAAALYLWQPWQAVNEPRLKLGLDLQGGLRVVLQAEGGTPTRDDLNVARRVIENRINQFGVSEPVIQTSGDDRIVVELPGLSTSDQDRALDLIGKQAVLEFRLVKQASAGKADSEMTLDDLEAPAFTGKILAGADAGFDQYNRPVVTFQIKGADAGAFGDFTASDVGRRMAIVLDGQVMSAPTINSRISTSGQITGIDSVDEASDLALVLRSGSLPISLSVAGINAVGPTLGQDAINSGVRAAIIGGLAVIVLVLIYYGPLFGGILVCGLLYVMLLNLGALAGLHATLTLPGLAGLILTLGAAADGNVISFERIREELRVGKTLRMAMKGGFSHSIPAIIDTHVAVLLAAASLYQFTTGPVRGFAVTLALGILASVFMNTVMVPAILEVLAHRHGRTYLPKGFHAEGIDFVGKAPIVMTISVLLAVASLAFAFTRGLNPSTDFTGGSDILLTVPESTTVNDVRKAIDSLDVQGINGSNAIVQELQDPSAEGREISIRVGQSPDGSNQNLSVKLAEAVGGEVLQNNFVGPAVGQDLKKGAIYAAVSALLLILAYVAWRFRPNWIIAFAAIIASVHDVGVVLGALALVHAEFSIPVLAALLFVIGYSLNDSIIIADRIRENLRTVKGQSYKEVVDLSVNQTLSRTVMTSATTILPVVALFFFGGSVLHDFSLVLLVGILFGTYSSIFILAPMVVWFKNQQRKRASAGAAARNPA